MTTIRTEDDVRPGMTLRDQNRTVILVSAKSEMGN